MAFHKCAICGKEALVDGSLYGPMRVAFRPLAAKFLTLDTGDVMVKATMCRECGDVRLTGDVRKLQRLIAGSRDVS